MGIAQQLKAARENAVMWRTELAEASGVTQSCIKHIETGRRSPTAATLEKLAAALNTTFTIGEGNG